MALYEITKDGITIPYGNPVQDGSGYTVSYSRTNSGGNAAQSYGGTGPAEYSEDAYKPSAQVTNYDNEARAKQLTPDYSLNYQPDAAGKAYQQAMQKIGADLGTKPTYSGKYDAMLEESYNNIVNRGEFKWDADTDDFYKAYEQRYTDLGQKAMKDTMGQAANLTGGYGNSYAQYVGNAAYNDWMDALMEKSVQLEQRAYDRWKDAGAEMYNQFGLLSNLRDNDYGRYRDDVSDYNYNLALLQAYEADNYARAQYNNNLRIQAEQTGYDRARDELSDLRYNEQMGYDRWRDQVSDERYADETVYSRWRDQVADDRYAEEFAYQQQRDAAADAQWQQEFAYQQARAAAEDAQWQQELALKQASLNGSGGSSGGSSSGRSSGGGSSGGSSSGGSSSNPYGYSSSEVLNIQRQLNGLGAGLAEDGIWGPKTQAAYDKYYNGATTYASNYGTYNMGELIDAAASGMSKSQIESVLRSRGIDTSKSTVQADIRTALSK